MAIMSMTSSRSLILLCALACTSIVVFGGPCPFSNPNFGSETGVGGTFTGSLPNSQTLYAFGSDGPKSVIQCYRACKTWPTYKTKVLQPYNGNQGQCAFWVWTGKGGKCFLLGCKVCSAFNSFDGTGDSCSTNIADYYCSGTGPGAKLCTGGVKGDPHFTGGDGSSFEFTGKPSHTYCLISDKNIHVNAYYDGRYDRWGNMTNKPLTWIRRVSVLWAGHSIIFSARRGSRWEYDNGYMKSIVVDGRRVVIERPGQHAKFANDDIEIRWVSARKRDGDDEIDIYELLVDGVMNMIIEVRPEVPNLRTEEDGVVHFSLDFPILHVSNNVHGVLGQTYRPDHEDRLSNHRLEYNSILNRYVVTGENAEGFLDGGADDYISTDLEDADCAMSRYSAPARPKSNVAIRLFRSLFSPED